MPSVLSSVWRLAESPFTSEQRDASARLSEDVCLRGELAACLARETVWKHELHTTKMETQHFSTETNALTHSEIRSVQEKYVEASSGLAEVTGHCLASRAVLSNFEQQASTWK